MSFIDNLTKITEAPWYKIMMPKLYGWGAALVIIGALLGIASTIRFQTFVVLITFITFLFLRSRKIRQNFLFIGIILLIFLMPLSPVLFYNYTTHESIFDTNIAWQMQQLSEYQYPEWKEQMLQITYGNGSTIDAISVDSDLFLKNYFYNLFYNTPHRLFNFNYDNFNVSLSNSIPFLGLIPVIGGSIYLF